MVKQQHCENKGSWMCVVLFLQVLVWASRWTPRIPTSWRTNLSRPSLQWTMWLTVASSMTLWSFRIACNFTQNVSWYRHVLIVYWKICRVHETDVMEVRYVFFWWTHSMLHVLIMTAYSCYNFAWYVQYQWHEYLYVPVYEIWSDFYDIIIITAVRPRSMRVYKSSEIMKKYVS